MDQPTQTEHAMQACIEACIHCHQVCLQTAMNHCLKTGGKHVEAEPAFNRAIAASAESHGTDHVYTHYQRVQLAHSFAAMGRNEEALALARQALPAFENFEYASSKSIRELREFIARLDR